MAGKTSLFLCLAVLFCALEFGLPLVAASPWKLPKGDKCAINHHPDTSDLKGVAYRGHVRSTRIPSGRTYRYVHYAPRKGQPTLLFLHGFPESAYDWRRQFGFFHRLGYGIVAPDLLGYSGTDKPADVQAYSLKNMAREVVELLDCEGVETVVGVGHDLGSPILARLNSYYPSRIGKYAFLDIGYSAPPIGLTAAGIAALNKQTLATEGFEPFGYWSFFNETGTGHVLDAHQDSLWSLSYTDDPLQYWKTDFGPTGAMEAFLTADRKAPTGGFVSAEEEKIHNRIFDPKRGGYDPTLNQYRALYRDINGPDEAAIPKSAYNFTKPVLLLTATDDPLGTPALAENSTRPYAPDLTVRAIKSGHFLMLEKANEVNEALKAFIEG